MRGSAGALTHPVGGRLNPCHHQCACYDLTCSHMLSLNLLPVIRRRCLSGASRTSVCFCCVTHPARPAHLTAFCRAPVPGAEGAPACAPDSRGCLRPARSLVHDHMYIQSCRCFTIWGDIEVTLDQHTVFVRNTPNANATTPFNRNPILTMATTLRL